MEREGAGVKSKAAVIAVLRAAYVTCIYGRSEREKEYLLGFCLVLHRVDDNY